MKGRVLATVAAALVLMLGVRSAQAGQNAGATARMYWQVGTAQGDSSRNSTAAIAQVVVTVKGVKNIRGADVQLSVRGCSGLVPPAWQAQPGGCAEGAAALTVGGVGGTVYRNLFTYGGAVPNRLDVQRMFDYQDAEHPCLTPDSTETIWVCSAGSAGVARDSTREYAVCAFSIDLSGEATGGCQGDLADSSGPLGVLITANKHIPCSALPTGAFITMVDANAEKDLIPIEAGYDSLTWHACPDNFVAIFGVSPTSVFSGQQVTLTIHGRNLQAVSWASLCSPSAITVVPVTLNAVDSARVVATASVPGTLDGPLTLTVGAGDDTLAVSRVMSAHRVYIRYSIMDSTGRVLATRDTRPTRFHRTSQRSISGGCAFDDCFVVPSDNTYRRCHPWGIEFIDSSGHVWGKNCPVRTWTEPVAYSGGHDHDDSGRPTFCALSVPCPTSEGSCPETHYGNTGSDGESFYCCYCCPRVAGLYKVNFVSLVDTCPCFNDTSGAFTFWVGYNGLTELPPGEGYDLVGWTTEHESSHWGQPPMVGNLQWVAKQYHDHFSAYVAYNDMSLVWGGIFDLNQDWQGVVFTHPHGDHRQGLACDIRIFRASPFYRMSDQQKMKIHSDLEAAGFTKIIPEVARNKQTGAITGIHWHAQMR